MRRFLRNNGLSLVLMALFAISVIGQAATGKRVYNEEQLAHGQEPISMARYLRSGHFVEAIFENWESEFLQMGAFVLLTVFLYQKGSPESKDPDDPEEESEEREPSELPWPARKGGAALWLYQHSLSLTLGALFLGSLLIHAWGGMRETNREAALHGEPLISFPAYISSAQMWFESFQNWQSEFLSVAALVVLTVFLREKG